MVQHELRPSLVKHLMLMWERRLVSRGAILRCLEIVDGVRELAMQLAKATRGEIHPDDLPVPARQQQHA